jgi:hypothetical protein
MIACHTWRAFAEAAAEEASLVYPDSARNPTVASTANIAITTTSSTKVKAENFRRRSERRTDLETEEESFGVLFVFAMNVEKWVKRRQFAG